MIGLFFTLENTPNFQSALGNIELDATIQEVHEWMAEATMNPVESGSPITDHVIEQPDKLRINGFVSDKPLTSSQSFIDSFGAGGNSASVFDLLNSIIKARQVVTVYTKYKLYDNMIMTNLTIPRDVNIGNALEFTAEFVNVRFVESRLVEVPDGISKKADGKAGGKGGAVDNKTSAQANSGKKEVEKTEPKQTSALKRATDWALK